MMQNFLQRLGPPRPFKRERRAGWWRVPILVVRCKMRDGDSSVVVVWAPKLVACCTAGANHAVLVVGSIRASCSKARE